ncbi:hypothetical protein G6F23_015896 [Rhizopus arrhizus]|nr:hypothetical protein G6F23_015896 [Rhizopus arrhizus]
MRLAPRQTTRRFRLREKQVLMVMEGAMDLVLNAPGQEVRVRLEEQAVYSVPAGVWREVSAGESPVVVAVLCAGDQRKRIEWPAEVIEEAARQNCALDPDG